MSSFKMNDSIRKKMSLISTLSVPKAPEQQVKRHSIHGITDGIDMVKPHQEIGHLTFDEKHFLLAVERGDMISVNRILTQNAMEKSLGKPLQQRTVNINCVDPLGRSAILMAIDNENFEMLKLLIDNNVDIKDALLYAVSEEFVEAVELLLDVEEDKWKPGEIHSWDRRPYDTTIFTPDITPLILAAHRDNYEIIKILLDKEACLPIPHDSRCSCEDCKILSSEDSLLYSYSRINAYRALSSPCLIALSSKDPILTAFELSWALRRLSKQEHEFKADYEELRTKCQKFATNLLNHTRSSNELETLLNYNLDMDARPIHKTVRLDRLKLAVKLKQKEFVAHPNVQQLLASIWYEGLPGFRRRNIIVQTLEVLKIGIMFPVLSIIYILAPCSSLGKMLRTPFIKFICHSASYFFFLFLLVLTTMVDRGSKFKPWVMTIFMTFVFALMWNEIKTLWKDGLEEYLTDMWNINDFITTALYLCDIAIHVFLNFTEKGKYANSIIENRDIFDRFHPKLASEALFSTANIISTLKIVYIFSINPYLGPLQIVLARVIADIAKFFLLYVLVLFAFSNGLHHLLSPYSEIHYRACKNNTASDKCKDTPYSKFLNLFETTQTLFWTAFGEVDLNNFSLTHIQEPTKFWGMVMYGSFCCISIVVLLNLLIAMMDHSYNKIFEDADVEWKFARSKLWISYFEEGGTVPVPFNIIPTPKSFWYMLRWVYGVSCPKLQEDESRSKSIQMSLNEIRYRNVMKNLVQRYVIARQKRGNEHNTVTEDDVNELKQEVSAFRSELLQILRESGMKAKTLNDSISGLPGKKNRFKERRLIKGLNMDLSESISDSVEFAEAELERSLLEDDRRNEQKNTFSEILHPILHGTPISIFKKKKIKNIFSRAASKQSWDSADDLDCDLKTPDSAQLNEISEKRVWFTDHDEESPDSVEVCIDELCAHNTEIEFIDDSLGAHEQGKC